MIMWLIDGGASAHCEGTNLVSLPSTLALVPNRSDSGHAMGRGARSSGSRRPYLSLYTEIDNTTRVLDLPRTHSRMGEGGMRYPTNAPPEDNADTVRLSTPPSFDRVRVFVLHPIQDLHKPGKQRAASVSPRGTGGTRRTAFRCVPGFRRSLALIQVCSPSPLNQSPSLSEGHEPKVLIYVVSGRKLSAGLGR